MKLFGNKKVVFIATFIVLLIALMLSGVNRTISFFNTEYITSKTVKVEVEFSNYLELEKHDLKLYFAYNNVNSYNENKTKLSKISKGVASFILEVDSIPNLYRFDFDKKVDFPFSIEKVTIFSNDKSYKINLNNFHSHPSLKFSKRNENVLKLKRSNVKKVSFSPYIYLYHPIHIHHLNLLEYGLIIILLLLITYFLSNIIHIIFNENISEKLINELLLIFVFFTLPLEEHWNSKILIIIGMYITYTLFKKKQKGRIKLYSYFIYFIVSALSLLWSIDVSNSTILLGRMVPFILLPLWALYFPYNIDYKKVFSIISFSYITIGIYAITIASIRYFSTSNISEFFYHTLVSPFDANAIYISLLFLGVFIFELYFLLKKYNFISFFKLLFIFFFIILLSSKMMTFLSVLSIVIMSIYFISKKFDHKIYIGVSAIAITVLLILLFSSSDVLSRRFKKISNISQIKEVLQKEDFGHTYPWNGLTLRVLQLKSFLDIEKDKNFNPILGVGLNNGQNPLKEQYIKYNLYRGKPWEKEGGFLHYNFHNQYAQTLVELGLVGFIFLVFILYQGYSLSYYDKNILLFIFMIIFGFILITESLLVRQKGIVVFVLFPIVASFIVKNRIDTSKL